MSEESKAIRVISFNDKKKNCQKRAKFFLSAALMKGYNIVVMEADPKVSKQNEVRKETDKDLLNLRKANQKTYCDFILAYHKGKEFRIVEKSVTKDLPDGEVHLLWNA